MLDFLWKNIFWEFAVAWFLMGVLYIFLGIPFLVIFSVVMMLVAIAQGFYLKKVEDKNV